MNKAFELQEVLDALPMAALVREGGQVIWQNARAAAGWRAALLAGAEEGGAQAGLKVQVIPLAGGRELLIEVQDTEAYLQSTSSAISHELRSPLRGMAGFLGLLERRYAEQLDERGRRYITQALGGAEQLERMIEGLVRFLRSERRPLWSEVDLGVVMSALSSRRAELFAETPITWEGLPRVRGDRELLGTLLDALIVNAAQHGAGPVRVEGAEEGEFFVIRVRDGGEGFSDHEPERAFRPLRRGPGVQRGVGLGLSIARRVARAHGGDVRLEPGPETCVRVTLLKLRE